VWRVKEQDCLFAKLEACGSGFFAMGNKSAKACSLFIQKHGEESLAKTIEKMIDLNLNWNKLLENEKGVKASLGVLEAYR
jgi:hypothetical protein